MVGTHGHSDHIGNLNLFTNSTHIVCHDINKGSLYLQHPFSEVSLAANKGSVLSSDIISIIFQETEEAGSWGQGHGVRVMAVLSNQILYTLLTINRSMSGLQ